MLGKVLADGMFLAAFLKAAGTAANVAADALAAAAGSGALGILTSETGIGFAFFETAAGAELIAAASSTCVAAVATAGATHSAKVLSSDSEKLGNTSKPKLTPSKILKSNMIKEKIMKFPLYKFATHHIVAFKSKYAKGARDILDGFGIDYNAAENGVYLPLEDGKTAMNHYNVHTKVYYQKVEEMLQEATDRDEALAILSKIRQMLLNGTFPID